MAQKRNTVQLTQTALNRLQKLVDTGEYCSLDDAASHIIVSTLPSTGQYSPVLTSTQPKTTQPDPIQTSTPLVNVPLPHGDVLSTQDIVPTSQDISPGDAFLAMDFDN